MPEVILKPGRERSVLRRHPWIFSGAIACIDGVIRNGEVVEVFSHDNKWIGRGAYSHHSQITIRIWTWEQTEAIDEAVISGRIQRAINLRRTLFDRGDSNAFRLIHGESDGLPGLIVDQYDDVLVVQYLSAGSEYWQEIINRELTKITGLRSLYERSDADVRRLEGLPPRIGSITSDNIPTQVIIREHGLEYLVNIHSGHKTGFYLDQRNNRLAARLLSHGKDILDCFCYTGGFTLNAWEGGARSILAIDESNDALDLLRENLRINTAISNDISQIRGDVFQLLRKFRDSDRTFDLIILDPPKFAPTTSQVKQASRGYKDINLLAMKLLRENGILLTFSCSGGISQDLFEKIIAGAALDSGHEFQIIDHLHQAADHPVATNFPEGAYLKGLILRRI